MAQAAKTRIFLQNRPSTDSDTVVSSLQYKISNWLESTVSSGASIAVTSFVLPGGTVGVCVITTT